MRLWPFKKKREELSPQSRRELEAVRRRQQRVALELRAIRLVQHRRR